MEIIKKSAVTETFLNKRIANARATRVRLEDLKEERKSMSVSGLLKYCEETIVVCEVLLDCMEQRTHLAQEVARNCRDWIL